MVHVRRANQGTRRTPSIRETSRRIRRNRRTRRLPQIIVSLDNDIIEPTPSTINQSSPPIPTTSSTEDQYTYLEAIEEFPDYLSDNSTVSLDLNDPFAQRILAVWEHNATIALNSEQYNYSPENDDFYPPPSYSPVDYDEVDIPATPLAIPPINIEIPLATLEIPYSNSDSDEYIPPELYNYPREE